MRELTEETGLTRADVVAGVGLDGGACMASASR